MIKVDIVSGFLGAGKTTLIKRYLEQCKNPDEKIIVIENEFGPENIDGKKLSEIGVKVLELSNGCLCCTMKGEFETALLAVAKKGKPDRIIIEPTGLFILSEFFKMMENPEIKELCVVNAVITVVDAHGITYNASKYGMFFEGQIALCKTVLFGKTAGISSEQMKNAAEMVKRLNANATVITDDFLSLTDEQLAVVFESDTSMKKGQLIKGKLLSRGHSAFQAAGISVEKELDDEKIEGFISAVNSGRLGDIARIKGHLPVKDGAMEINYVSGNMQLKAVSGAKDCSINIIGEGLDIQALESFFNR